MTSSEPKTAAQIAAEFRVEAEVKEATSRSHKERLEESGYKPRTHQEIAAFNEKERKDLHDHGQGFER